MNALGSSTEEMAERDARIRERAYEIWEQEGRPFGQHERHWLQAEAELKGGARIVLSTVSAKEAKILQSPAPAKKNRPPAVSARTA